MGPLPHDPRQFIAAGYTGSGMNKAFLVGKAVAEWICAIDSSSPFNATKPNSEMTLERAYAHMPTYLPRAFLLDRFLKPRQR